MDQGAAPQRGNRLGQLAAVACLAPLIGTLLLLLANDELRSAVAQAIPLLLRYVATLVIPALVLLGLARVYGRSLRAADLAVVVHALAFLSFAGLSVAAAALLVLSTAAVVGSLLLGADAIARRPLAGLLVGLALVVGATGWLLPFRIHEFPVYAVLACCVLLVGRHQFVDAARQGIRAWGEAADGNPWLAFLTVQVVGFAAMLCWLPSMNPDDNAAHLLLGKQLLAGGYARLDVSSQVFAVAPWFNNVLHGILAVLSGGEARPAVGLIWLVLGCVGAYRLAEALGARGGYPWLAAALYASHPLAAYFGMTLQVDGASAALLLHLLAVCVVWRRSDDPQDAVPWLQGALCGALIGLKITNAIYVAVVGLWLIWRYGARRDYRDLLKVLTVALFVAGSSYGYAMLVTGNPLFPLFNGIFKSPYMATANFSDPRWHVGIGMLTPWNLTVASQRYMEAYPGAAGLALLGLSGAWVVSVASGRARRALLLFALATGLVVFWQVQYLRYIFPALAVACTVGVASIASVSAVRLAKIAVILLVIAQCGLIRTTSWILAAGAADELLAQGPSAVEGVERRFVPERALVRRLDAATQGRFCLLFAEASSSYVALAPSGAFASTFYDPRIGALAEAAIADASGAAWRALIDRVGFTHVELRPAQAAPGLLLALEASGFVPVDTEGEAQIWTRPGASATRCVAGTVEPRDEAVRLLGHEQ